MTASGAPVAFRLRPQSGAYRQFIGPTGGERAADKIRIEFYADDDCTMRAAGKYR
jgi:hypothetical protein